ncbi:formate dehydrogenase, alpha subunit [Methanotorris formicicus Mc-S-70]|nr:formate dehydrogenase, alpha subunit [Methanotorris formicicus Mc-S-70]
MTNSIEDIEEADCILIIGSNTFEQHPLIARRVVRAKDKGTKVIVIDPRKTPTAKNADLYLQITPGTNVALLNAMMHVIIKEGLIDEEFIKNRTKGFEELKKVVEKYTPEYASKICGVSPELIIEAAKIYGGSERSSILYCMGVTQFKHGVDSVKSCCNLAMITGNLGKRGTGVNPLRGQNNVQGACDMGALPNVFPGYQKVDVAYEKFEEVWGVELNHKVGLSIPEMIENAGKEIKCLYIMGENPMVSDPDIGHVEHALEELDFLIVQDIFLTETAKLADVVLPAACWAEKDGTFTNTERRVQKINKAVNPPGEALEDWIIIKKLAEKMGYKELFNYNSPREIFEEIRKVTPQYAGITYERLGVEGIPWPCKDENHPGTPILHTEKFLTPDGLGVIFPIEYEDPGELPDNEYPFILTTGRVIFHYHTGTMTRRSKHMVGEINEGFVEIHPEDAKKLGIKNNELVKVSSRRGEVIVKARITENIKKDVVFMPFHFAETTANILTNTVLDPNCKIPELKVCAVKVEKLKISEGMPSKAVSSETT